MKFYVFSTSTFLICIVGGFYAGGRIAVDLLFSSLSDPYAEEALAVIPYLLALSFLGVFVGFFTSIIIIHKLGKRWGGRLNFGGHPVLKLTCLSFLTFLGLLLLLLLFYPSK